MRNFFFRFWVIILAFSVQTFVAQKSQEPLSDAELNINNTKVKVKVFATTNFSTLNNFATENINNTLVILNEDNFEHYEEANAVLQQHNELTRNLIKKFKEDGYQFLDKNFKPSDVEINLENSSSIKYLLKADKKLTAADKVELETTYKIWDPAKGIKIGSFMLHFYSLMFIFAFGFGFILMTKMFKIDNVNLKYIDPLFTWTLIGTILGARLGHVIFYQPELFKQDFWSVFLPIQTKPSFKFTGFSGLASHGATIALIFTTLYYSFKIIKKNPLWVYDRLVIVVALGGAFVRMGNFFNSEIIGKAVSPTSPFAILFPQMSDEYGVTIPRYPSQLFEAIGYFILFFILWFIYRKTNKKYQQGWIFGFFFVILWSIRFFVEFLKEPQGDEFISFAGLNTGQILSIPFIIAGFVLMLISKKYIITEEENAKPDYDLDQKK